MAQSDGTTTTISRQKKIPKGKVKIESDKGWLRLRFTHAGKRRAFALGLPDTTINRKFAEQKANQIDLDIISNNFDSSLQKYKPQKSNEELKTNSLTVEELIRQFIEYKSKFVSSCKKSNDHNFRDRAWKSVLSAVGVEYRKPYTTRHTLISHALNRGMNPIEVAQLTGHDVQTLYENYAGNVNSRPKLPEIIL